MSISGFSGGKGLEAALKRIADGVSKAQGVRVGFLEDATYPDGAKVAYVAAIQNFGAPEVRIPARPFFSNMVREKSPDWGSSLGEVLKQADYDAQVALGQMGEGISAQLQQSIKDTNEPALSPITLMLRKMRSEDQTLVVSGKTVGEAARRVANGESTAGVNTKPLNDTAHMQNSVDYEVKP